MVVIPPILPKLEWAPASSAPDADDSRNWSFTVTGSPHVAQPRAEVPTVELSLKGSLLGFLEA